MKEFSEENKEHGTESSEYTMDDFHAEVQGLIDENMRLANQGKMYNPHFGHPHNQTMKAGHLNESDKEAFVCFKKALRTMDDADIDGFYEALGAIKQKKSIHEMSEEEESRINLYGYLVNEGMTFQVAKLEKMEKERKKNNEDKELDSGSGSGMTRKEI